MNRLDTPIHQGVELVLEKNDLAKYPFVSEAAEYVRLLGLKIESLSNPELRPVLDRAENRVEEALLTSPPEVSYRLREDEIEVPSFPVAVILAAATANDYIKRRYALAEARRVYELLRMDDEEKILEIAKMFNWRVRMIREAIGFEKYEFALSFVDFLENAGLFREKRWKLVNRFMVNGEVYLTKHDVARLLQEEVRRHIEKRLNSDVRSKLTDDILGRVDRLRKMYTSRVGEVQFEEEQRGVVNEAFPPCIRQLYEAASSGRHISHVGRFTLTSFLLRIGMPVNKIVDLFRASSDFDERMTRYQVEHIAGDRGSRTRYIPPMCETLQTHGVCPGVDEICRSVRHPLAYYRRKIRMLKRENPAGQA